MKLVYVLSAAAFLSASQIPVQAADADLFGRWSSDTDQFIQLAGDDDRQDRREERGRSDERHDRRDCRQDEGVVGKDKRDCKQEEVRDGVRGNQGERLDGDNDNDNDNDNDSDNG